MAIRTMLECMRAIDVAWNERRWPDYADLLSDDLVAYESGESNPHGKAVHVEKAKRFCEAFPDAVVHGHPYLSLFASHDGKRTCSVARVTGTARGDMKMPSNTVVAPVHRRFDVNFTVICEWRDYRIVEQYKFFDMELMLRQFRGEADPPSS